MSDNHAAIWTPDGHKRILNLQPSPPELVRLVSAGPVAADIPLSEIEDFDAWPESVKIKDQNGYGACGGHANATAAEFACAMTGHHHGPLSAWWCYGRLAMGRDRGSNILEGLKLAETEGIAPESLVKYGDFSGRYSAEVVAAAAKHKVEVARRLTTWEEIVSAVALRQAVNLSVHVPRVGWEGRLDADGCPAVGRGMGNHAVMVGGGIKTLRNGEKAVRMANSWAARWGDNGFCWLKRAHIESGTWFEAYAVVSSAHAAGDDGVVAA